MHAELSKVMIVVPDNEQEWAARNQSESVIRRTP